MFRGDKLYLACLFGFLFNVLYFSKISYGGNLTQANILGNWQAMYRECENDIKIIITDTYIITGSSFSLIKFSYSISDSVSFDGSISLKLFNAKISADNGLNYSELGSKTDTIKANIFIEKDILVLLIWKGGDRLDEFQIAAAYTRKNESEPFIYQPSIQSKFYLPDGYTGYAWVAMAQSDGDPAEYDRDGRRILKIPESGLLLTQSKPMPTALAKREFAFYYQMNDGLANDVIPVLPSNCLFYFTKSNLSEEQLIDYGFNPNQIYVHYYRYNNPPREKLNKLFETEIKGQVFWFRVDTLRNLLKSEPMIPRLQKIENN